MKAAVAVVSLALLATGCTRVDRVTEAFSPSPSAPPSVGSSPSPAGHPSIAIETPFVNGEVASPVSITGTADVVDATLVVRVLDGDGDELAATVVQASCGDGCVGTFAAELFFFIERSQPGTIRVSGVGEGGDPAVAEVPVVLFPA
jgi:hypothetical protein